MIPISTEIKLFHGGGEKKYFYKICANNLIIYLTCVADQSFHIETFQLFIFQLDEDDLSFETQNFNEKLCKLKTFLLDISIHIMVRSLWWISTRWRVPYQLRSQLRAASLS